MAKVFVFDLDDTLYKEIDYLKSAYKEIATKLEAIGVIDAYPQMIAWYETKQNVFDKINEYYHLNVSNYDLLNWYRYHLPHISLSEGATDLLKSIIAYGNKVGLITDGRSKTQRNKIEALGLLQYVDSDDIIISEEFGSEKPNPRNYEYFEVKYPEAEYIYIADNTDKDFVMPNRLGWVTIGLLDDGRNIHRQKLNTEEDFQPRIWLKSLTEIITILL
jgi:putative hydrolase of the HAD superfamily